MDRQVATEDIQQIVDWLGGKATQEDVASLIFLGDLPKDWKKEMPREFFDLPTGKKKGLL